MLNQTISENWQWVCLWAILILTAIYSRPLIPIDETRYLSVAWEMWQSNDFLVPHINGSPYSHKPPLLFWFIHLSWFMFGVGEWAGRIVAPLFGLGSLMLTVGLANLLWPGDKDVRVATPFILLGTFIWSMYSSLTMFDTLLTFFSLLGLVCVLEAQNRKSILPWIGLSLSIGLGILSKGPISLLYILPPVFFAPWWSHQNTLSWKHWYNYSLLSFILGLGIAGCWVIPAARSGGPEYQHAIFFSQTAGRMVRSFTHARPFYWYLLLTPLLCFPWFFYFPAWRGWKKGNSDYSKRFCLSAILPPLILLSLVSGKQIHYVLPILPVAALLVARVITTDTRRKSFDRIPLLLIFLVLSIVLPFVPKLSQHGGDAEMLKHIHVWITVIPLACGFLLFCVRMSTIVGSIKMVSSSMLMLIVFLHLAIASPLHETYDQSEISDKLRSIQAAGGEVAVFPAHLKDQFQFSGRLTKPLKPIRSFDELAFGLIDNPQYFCLIFTKSNQYRVLIGNGVARSYRNGWLILRPTYFITQSLVN